MSFHRLPRRGALVLGSVVLLQGCSAAGNLQNMLRFNSAADKTKKVYDTTQKLKALAFTVTGDPAGGEFAFVATKEVKKFPIGINVDIAATPIIKSVSAAGIAVPLNGGTSVSFDAGLRGQLQTKGVPAPVVTEMESNLNAGLAAIASLNT